MSKAPAYPFVPKSTAYLQPGQFWSIPLLDGRFACGRVIQLRIKNGKRHSRKFLAGLMDWVGDEMPTAADLIGRGSVDQGQVHVKTIGENKGQVVGFRDLSLDRLEPYLFRDAQCATFVQRGLEWLRPYDSQSDSDLPVCTTWGYRVIKILAEKHFRGKRT
jgi:hypothetical protein